MDGIDPHFLMSITDQYGTIDKDKAKTAGYLIEDGNAWLTKDVDVLMPSAIERPDHRRDRGADQQAGQDRRRGRQRP